MVEDGNEDEKIALFRYALIVPVLNGTYTQKSINEYFTQIATIEYTLPNGKKRYYDISTFKKWYYLYRKLGFDGLKPGVRSDSGSFKRIPISILETIKEIQKTKLHITKRGIYEELCNIGEIRQIDVSESTFYRFLRNNNVRLEQEESGECKAYEAAKANDIWQADTSNVMRIKVNNKSEVVYLVQIIDDASRMIVGQVLTYHDNAVVFQETLKKAVKIYGIPKVLYVDNGAPYANEQLSLICANLGIHLIHAKPYSPRREGQGREGF